MWDIEGREFCPEGHRNAPERLKGQSCSEKTRKGLAIRGGNKKRSEKTLWSSSDDGHNSIRRPKIGSAKGVGRHEGFERVKGGGGARGKTRERFEKGEETKERWGGTRFCPLRKRECGNERQCTGTRGKTQEKKGEGKGGGLRGIS